MGEQQVVVFGLNNQLFGTETSQVFQIIKFQEAIKVPSMPVFIEGILEYMDTNLPVISLNKRFGFGNDTVKKKTKIIVANIEGMFAGFIVNDVMEITKFDDDNIESAPHLKDSVSDMFLKKVAKKDGKLIPIIDLEKVLSESEIKRLSIKTPNT